MKRINCEKLGGRAIIAGSLAIGVAFVCDRFGRHTLYAVALVAAVVFFLGGAALLMADMTGGE